MESLENDEIVKKIGLFLGFDMKYENCSHRDNYVEAVILYCHNLYLLIYQQKGYYDNYSTLYTLNLSTLRPTANSHIKTLLSNELLEELRSKLGYKTYKNKNNIEKYFIKS